MSRPQLASAKKLHVAKEQRIRRSNRSLSSVKTSLQCEGEDGEMTDAEADDARDVDLCRVVWAFLRCLMTRRRGSPKIKKATSKQKKQAAS